MSRKLLVIVFLFVATFVFAPGSAVRAQTLSGPPVAKNQLPDLIVSEIIFETTGRTKIRVRVLNQGAAASSSCHLALRSMTDDPEIKSKQRVWTIEIPALQAGKGISQVINVLPLTQAMGPWKAVIDRSNVVKESNEGNNDLEVAYSQPVTRGGVVNVPMPDLQITRAVLIDSTAGEVSVEVSNMSEGPAKASQLRLIVWKMGKFEQQASGQVFVKVPAINPHNKTNVKIKAGVPIISTKYSLYIDINEEVKEKNENNNRFEGQAGKS